MRGRVAIAAQQRSSEGELSAAEVEALDRDGYLVLEGVLDERLLTRLRQRLAGLAETEGPFGGVAELTPLQRFAARRDHRLALRPLAAGLRLAYRVLRTTCQRVLFPAFPRWAEALRSVHGSPGFGSEPLERRAPGRLGHTRIPSELRAAATGAAYHEPGARRTANLLDKDGAFDVCLDHPRVRAAVAHLLGEEPRLSSLNARTALGGGGGTQPLHTDWESGSRDGRAMACNTLWLLDDFTSDNGPTRIVPGTHRTGCTPAEALADPRGPVEGERHVLARAGSVLVLNAHVWHGGTANRSDSERRILQGFFTRRGQPRQLDPKRTLRPETVRRLTDSQLRLAGLLDRR